MISVAVLPIKSQDPETLREEDIEIITQRGHGKGGQHQNTTDSAVRIKHIPTKLSVFINGRDQHSNKKEALKILTAKVNQLKQHNINTNYSNLRTKQMDNGTRSNKIRTYNFAESRVIDHKLNTKSTQIKRIMKGEFNLLIQSNHNI